MSRRPRPESARPSGSRSGDGHDFPGIQPGLARAGRPSLRRAVVGPTFTTDGSTPVIRLRVLLLTHEHELTKSTNTGRVVLDALDGIATRIIWRRTDPDEALLQLIDTGGVGLVWPGTEEGLRGAACELQAFIVIDGTWQQARKIYNRSPYLHGLPTIALEPDEPSIYTLRRNQIGGGLCTAEAVACLLRQPGLAEHDGIALARALETRLRTFLAGAGSSTPRVTSDP